MKVRWKVREVLDKHGKTPYALWKASGLPRNTVYAIAQGETDGAQFDTLSKLIGGLEQLTGQQFELADVLELVRA